MGINYNNKTVMVNNMILIDNNVPLHHNDYDDDYCHNNSSKIVTIIKIAPIKIMTIVRIRRIIAIISTLYTE